MNGKPMVNPNRNMENTNAAKSFSPATVAGADEPDPWDKIIQDPSPRPELDKAAQEALEDYLQGRTTPLDPDNMP
ncbi:MAG: hypothetical protein KKE86_15980 [Planctomycetes bacterium]|nr:hypothetical protein [Planctomycetota bacterium]